MSVVPQGKAIQAMYREYRDGNLMVNRKYQRKLVWSIEEKRALIDSIIKGYPIPLILLAERPDVYGTGKYEIVDGIQRLNAIFSFIEQSYDIGGAFFDVSQFPTAKQHAESGAFTIRKDAPVQEPKECSRFLDYQLALTIYPAREELQITDLFGRINSGGRQLSPHEQRQAGVITQFSSIVRTVSAELRGDVSQDVLLLSQMPEISVESGREPHGYGIRAEDTLWCRQGILSNKQLKESEDEQLVADIAASIVLGQPLAVSRELLDTIYDSSSVEGQDLERRIIAYGTDRLRNEIKFTFSVLKQTIENCTSEINYLRSTVRPGRKGQYPIKAPFYAIFMAFHDLVVKEQKTPADNNKIMASLRGLSERLQTGTHYETTENRAANIGVADKKHDAERISNLDNISPYKIAEHFIVGVDREVKIMNLSLDNYVQRIIGSFQKSQLSEPLKTQILSSFDTITVHGFSVIRILIPRQKTLSYVGNKSFSRQGSSTIELIGQQLVSASRLFPN